MKLAGAACGTTMLFVVALALIGTCCNARPLVTEGNIQGGANATGSRRLTGVAGFGEAFGGLIKSVTDAVQSEEDATLKDLKTLEDALSKTSVGRRKLQSAAGTGRQLKQDVAGVGDRLANLVKSITLLVQSEEDATLKDLKTLETALGTTSVGRRKLQQDVAGLGEALAALLKSITDLVQSEEDSTLKDLKILEGALPKTSVGRRKLQSSVAEPKLKGASGIEKPSK
jgi:hypothetical protein